MQIYAYLYIIDEGLLHKVSQLGQLRHLDTCPPHLQLGCDLLPEMKA
jgi:hypothetical protein